MNVTQTDRGLETIVIGRLHLISWTAGNGDERVAAYVPIGDREYPDGLMLVGGADGRQHGNVTRDASIAAGRRALHLALAERDLLGLAFDAATIDRATDQVESRADAHGLDDVGYRLAVADAAGDITAIDAAADSAQASAERAGQVARRWR